jgi:phytoene synthase
MDHGMASLSRTRISETALTRPEIAQALAWKQAEQTIRAHSKTFFLATALLPFGPRRGIRALYGFCRTTDDLVDAAEQCCTGLAEINAWRHKNNLPVSEQTDPILYAWAQVRETYQVDRRYEQELIDGVAMDILIQSYATWHELEQYCYYVAATVGLLSMPIIGLARTATFEQAAPYAIQLGIALQLTNILRDVGEDAHRGRVYLPVEDLKRFYLTREDILNGVFDERFIDLMRFEISRARDLYHQALPGIKLLSSSARPAVGAAALLYREILTEIENMGFNVYQRRAFSSGWKKIRMLPGILATIWRIKTPKTI